MINILDWDSKYFGFIIANLDYSETESIDKKMIDDFAKSKSIRMIQCLCDISDINQINNLEQCGFHFVDMKVDFKKYIKIANNNSCNIIEASVNDINELKNLASGLYANSRYYHEQIPEDKSRLFYQIWIENAVKKTFDDICFVAKQDDDIEGFITLKYSSPNVARIGLIGVDNKQASKGFGSKLISYSENFLFNKSFNELYVSTQGNNILAQNFYIKNGFRIDSIKNWYYKFY